MNITRRHTFALAAGVLAGAMSGPALAAGTVVQVSLWDKGPDSMSMLGMGPAMGMAMGGPGHGMGMGSATGRGGKGARMGPMGITATPDSVPAGEVTFEVVNDSKDIIHEMIVSPVADVNTPLPYDTEMERVDEDAAGHLGEVSELDPGQSGALRLTLKPGQYILFCNIPGHYVLGMWTLLTVTG